MHWIGCGTAARPARSRSTRSSAATLTWSGNRSARCRGPCFPRGRAKRPSRGSSGAGHSLADVLDELFTLPFFSRRRLVVVEEADTFVTKHRKDLEAYVGSPSASGTLLLQVKVWTATTNLAKLVDKVGLAIDCNALPEKQSPEGRLVADPVCPHAVRRPARRRRGEPPGRAGGPGNRHPGRRGGEARRLRGRFEADRARGRRPDGRGRPGRDGLEGPRRRHDRPGEVGTGIAGQSPGGRRGPRGAARGDELHRC